MEFGAWRLFSESTTTTLQWMINDLECKSTDLFLFFMSPLSKRRQFTVVV